ncbi:hypothetical protein ILYODFUR_012396 [Ilyodon furcidens]|uniref:Uncharacterized protein n=1 Tax=Ilyodon furcidens TaxID=33524 RepID=A0ABV0TU04_9TELE
MQCPPSGILGPILHLHFNALETLRAWGWVACPSLVGPCLVACGSWRCVWLVESSGAVLGSREYPSLLTSQGLTMWANTDLLLCWMYDCPGVMLYVWLPGTAVAFLNQQIKLAVSCFLRLLDQGISAPCPPSNASICTLNLLLLSPSSLKQHQRNHLNKLCFENLDPESLYPWRPDDIHLLAIHLFTFLIICCTIKHNFTDSVLQSVCGSDLF